MSESKDATFAAKWRHASVVGRGFACVPKCLFTCMGELNLKSQEAMILINIIEKCWHDGDKAWPSVEYLAKNTGRKNSATRDSLRSLAKKGFINKEQRFNTSNLYDLEPCINMLAEHVKDCRHLARKPAVSIRKTGGVDSRKSGDYLEAEIINNEADPFYSHIVDNNDDDSGIEIISKKNLLHPCETDGGVYKHDWDEPFDRYKGMRESGEEVILRYWKCKRCQEMFHAKANPKDYRWEDGKLINITEYARMEEI